MYFARNGVVIGGYYAAYGFTADVSRRQAPRSGFVQRPLRPTMRIAKAGFPLPAVHPAIRVLRNASEQIGRDEIL